MQGFGMGRYRPPTSNPRTDPFNTTHPLGNRARHLSLGILIVRFELPFHIFCLSCSSHIPQGRRFNAQKKHVDSYLDTKIYSFTCKCTCGSHFEIRTDPKNAQYIVQSGAKRQIQDWDPQLNGGHPIYDTDKSRTEPQDAFEIVEKEHSALAKVKEQQERVAQLQQLSDSSWSDPYGVNAKLRRGFREQKRKRAEQAEEDQRLRARIGWNSDRLLLPSVEQDSNKWHEQLGKTTAARKGKSRDMTAAERLRSTLVAKTRLKRDPFLSASQPHRKRKPDT